MTALSWRDLDLLSQKSSPTGEGIRIQVVRGFLLPPEVRGEDYIVAALAGRVSGNRISDVAHVTLAGYIVARTPAEWRVHTDLWIATLDENGVEPGNLLAEEEYLGMAPGASATFVARVKNILEGDVVSGRLQRWSVELESAVPAPGWNVTVGD